MSVWQKLLTDLRGHLDRHLAGHEHEAAIKLTQAVETEFLYELRGAKPGATLENTVAMTPTEPVQIIERPEYVCIHCGMTMLSKKIDLTHFIVDHGPTPPGCPWVNLMWKVEAKSPDVVQKCRIPDFVRQAKIL